MLACKASSKLSLALVQVAIAINAAKLRANLLLLIVKKHVFTISSFKFLFGYLLGFINEIITRRPVKNGKILVTLTKKYFLVSNFKFDIIATMIEILLIEDDLELAELLKFALAKSEIDVTIVTNPLEGLRILNEKNTFDALVLDLGLPDMDGLDVCKHVRQGYPSLPIIISSARSETLDKIKGFELGADDYMAKPYEPIELAFRLRAILRRGIQTNNDSKTFCVDKQRRIVIKNKEEIALTKAEFDIFIYLYEKEGLVVPREDILINLGQAKFQSGLKSIDVAIGRLRQKIGDDPKNPRFIHPVRGIGYKFINA